MLSEGGGCESKGTGFVFGSRHFGGVGAANRPWVRFVEVTLDSVLHFKPLNCVDAKISDFMLWLFAQSRA